MSDSYRAALARVKDHLGPPDTRPTMRVGLHSAARYKNACVQLLRARDGDNCYLCGIDLNTVRVAIEHIVPLSRGGTDDASNLALACFNCNAVKGDRYVSITITDRRIRLHAT